MWDSRLLTVLPFYWRLPKLLCLAWVSLNLHELRDTMCSTITSRMMMRLPIIRFCLKINSSPRLLPTLLTFIISWNIPRICTPCSKHFKSAVPRFGKFRTKWNICLTVLLMNRGTCLIYLTTILILIDSPMIRLTNSRPPQVWLSTGQFDLLLLLPYHTFTILCYYHIGQDRDLLWFYLLSVFPSSESSDFKLSSLRWRFPTGPTLRPKKL